MAPPYQLLNLLPALAAGLGSSTRGHHQLQQLLCRFGRSLADGWRLVAAGRRVEKVEQARLDHKTKAAALSNPLALAIGGRSGARGLQHATHVVMGLMWGARRACNRSVGADASSVEQEETH